MLRFITFIYHEIDIYNNHIKEKNQKINKCRIKINKYRKRWSTFFWEKKTNWPSKIVYLSKCFNIYSQLQPFVQYKKTLCSIFTMNLQQNVSINNKRHGKCINIKAFVRTRSRTELIIFSFSYYEKLLTWVN